MTATPPVALVSHYRLIELLGRGAMGEVWLAEDTQLPRKVAVKLLPAHLAEDGDSVDRLLREAQAAASVDHPGVVTVYEAGLAEGRPYLVMQRVEGDTLEQRLARGPLPVAEAVALATAIADALAEVHALGIVHRDLKPSNIVLTARGPKILDFGVAAVRGAPRMTSTGAAVGSPLTMSPEQIRGLPPDNRCDLWALGAILYETLTGQAPFAGAQWEAIAHRVLNEQPPPVSRVRPEIGTDLDFIVAKLLRKDPAQRYARAEDLLADLASCGNSVAAPGDSVAPAAAAPPRLAVLYFEVLSADPDDAFVAAGLTEDLIVDLARVRGLHVSSRGEVLPYRDRALPPRTLGRELGADFVLQGSVRRAGQRARISAQLVRTTDGHAIWAERFDRTLEDLFDVQAEVSKRIVEALQVTLTPGEREMLDRAPTQNAEAYQEYLGARKLIDFGGKTENRQAEALLRRAVSRDPNFALAHATLGECIVRRGLSWWAGIETGDEAQAHATRALALEPDLLEAHLVMAMVHRLKGQPTELLGSIDRVLALDPENAQAGEWAGWCYMTLGRPEDAIALLERVMARHRERYTTTSYLVNAYEMAGRVGELGRVRAQFTEQLLDAVRREPGNVHARSLLSGALIGIGQQDAGVEQALQAVSMAPDDGRVRYNAACALAQSGRPEEAIAQLVEAVRNVPSYLADWPRRDPDLESLRDHPEFIRLFGTL